MLDLRSRRGGKLRVVRLWLSVLVMAPGADKTGGIAIILFSCHRCLISKAKS